MLQRLPQVTAGSSQHSEMTVTVRGALGRYLQRGATLQDCPQALPAALEKQLP